MRVKWFEIATRVLEVEQKTSNFSLKKLSDLTGIDVKKVELH